MTTAVHTPTCRNCGTKFPGRVTCKSCGNDPSAAPTALSRVVAEVPGKNPADRKRRKALLRSLSQQPKQRKHGR